MLSSAYCTTLGKAISAGIKQVCNVPTGCYLVEPGSFLQRFFDATQPMSAAERGAYLENPPGDAPDIEEAHQVSKTPPDGVNVMLLYSVTPICVF